MNHSRKKTVRPMYTSPGVSSESMTPTTDDRTKKRHRTHGTSAPIPYWFAEAVDRKRREKRLTLIELGVAAAKAAHRPRPWRHPSIHRFFNGSPTAELAEAFCRLFPELPRWAYYPQDEEEAFDYEKVRLDADARRKKQERVAPMARAIDERAGVVPGPVQPDGDAVASRDGLEVEAARGGRRDRRVRADLSRGGRRVAASRSRSSSRRS